MPYQGVVALVVGVGIIVGFFHYVFGVEALTLFTIIFAKLLLVWKWVLARMSFEIMLGLVVSYFKRTIFKLVTYTIPSLLVTPIVSRFVISPAFRKKLVRKVEAVKAYVFDVVKRPYVRARAAYQRFFGAHAWVAFVLSLLVAVLSFIYSVTYFQFEFFVWIGSWGPVATLLRWLRSGVMYLLNYLKGYIYRIPKIGVVLGFFGYLWHTKIAPRIPTVESIRKRMVYRSLRAARKTRTHSLKVYLRFERMHLRFEAKRPEEAKRREVERKRQKALQALLDLERWLHPFLHHWESMGLNGFTEFQRLRDDRMRLAADNLYAKAFLGAEVRGVVVRKK